MRRARPPTFVRAVHARRRVAARSLRRLGLVAVSFLLSAVTVVPFLAQESEALDPVVFKAVQSGTATLSAGSTVATVPINAVDPAQAFLVFGLEENLGRPGDGAVSGRLVNATSLRFERAEGGGTVSIRWQVAEFTSGVRVQRGTRLLDSTPASVAISAVDRARSFVLTSSHCGGDYWADNDFVRSRLTSATNLELATTVVDSVPSVEWQVVEYAEAAVQHGTVSLSAGQAAATVSVTAVDPQRAWLITSYRVTVSGNPPIGERLVRGRVTSASTLVFDRWVTSGSVDIAWSLVEFQDGTEVRHGSERFASGEAQRAVTISAVDPARSIGAAGYQTTGGSSPYNSDDLPGIAFFTTQLVDGSTLRLRRGATIDPADVGWFVVYFRGHPPAFQQDLTDRTDAEGATMSQAAPATDPDGDTLTYSATGLPPGLVVDAATGTMSGTISYDAAAGSPYAVVLRVADPRGLFATDSFTWTITNTNRAPVVTSPGDRTDGEGTVVSLQVVGSDPDGDPLAWTATDLPPGLDMDPATGMISGTILPTAVLGSPYAVVVRADDPGGLFGTAAFTWTVTGSGAPGGGNTYLVAGTGGAAGGDDLLTVADRGDTNPATNEIDVGSGTGTFSLFGLDQNPGNGLLYGSDGNRLGLVSMVTGVFTPLGGTFGSGSGPAGAIAFNAVHGIAFDPASGSLYAVHNVAGDRDVLFRVDPASGSRVAGAFGGDDYVVIDPSHDKKKETYDLAFDPTTGLLWALGADHPADGPERVGILNPATGYLDLRDGKLDSLNPRGLAFDADGNLWGVGSPGTGGRLFLIDKGTGKPGFAVPVDNGGDYQAVEIIYHRPPVFDLDLGDRTDPEGALISLTAPASDPDGDSLTWSATGLPPGLTIDPGTGVVSGTISHDAAGGSPYGVSILVADPGGLSDTDTFTWTVTDTNRPPSFEDDLGDRTDAEGAVVSLSGPASDPDGDSLTWSASGLPPGVSIAPATGLISGTVSYDAAAGSPYPVVVRVQDPGGLFATDSFAWSITNTNRAPAFDDPPVDRADGEGSSVLLPNPASDPDGDPLTWSAAGLPPGLSIDPSSGVISGTIAVGASAASPYLVQLRVEDPGGLSAAASFTWTVGPAELLVAKVSDAPGRVVPGQVITYTITVTNQGTAPHVGIRVEDVIPAGTTYLGGSGEPPPVLLSNGVLGSGDALTLTFQVRADDPLGESQISNTASVTSARQVVPVTATAVDPTNRPPALAFPGDQASAEAEAVTLPLGISDPDGDLLAWSAAGLPPGLGIDGATGVISGTITYDASPGSPYTVTVRVEDAGGLDDSVVFAWLVADTNRPPIFDGDLVNRTDAEGQGISLAAPATDLDGDTLTWSAAGLPPGLAIDPATGLVWGTITYEASPGSPYAVELRVEDGRGLSDTDAFSWFVTDTNRAPVLDAGLGNRTDAEGDAVALPAPATDPDGDTLTWSAAGLPPGLAIDPAAGVISGTVSYDASPGSPYLVVVRVEDQGGLFDTEVFSWTATDTNRSPVVADPGGQGSGEGQVVLLPLAGSDPDGDSLTWSAANLPPGLSVDPVTGAISGTIDFEAAVGSPYAVTVRATDDGSPALWAEASFAWVVADSNRAPVVVAPADRSDAEGEPVSLAVVGSDPDGDALVWSATGLPAGLSMDPASGVISGTIGFEASAASPYGVAVTATDDGSPVFSTTVSFLWAVVDANRAPQLLHPGDQWDAEGSTVSLAPVASDPDGDTLAWSAVGLPPGLSIDPATGLVSGTLGYEAAAGSPHLVTITVTDDRLPSLTGSATFNWTVADTNRAPVVTGPGPQGSGEGQSVTLAIQGLDPDGDAITWTAEGLPPGLSIDPASGLITGATGFEASPGSPYAVTVRATDDGTPVRWGEASFTWVVADANRAPLVGNPGEQRAAEGDAVSLPITGVDLDGDRLVWSAVGLPPGLAIDPFSGRIAGTIGFEASPGSPYAVMVMAADDGVPVLSSGVSFLWVVADTNRAPLLAAGLGNRSDAEGTQIATTAPATDPDGDTLTWSAVNLPPGLSINPVTGAISGMVSYDASPGSPYLVVVRVEDARGLSDAEAFSWSVTNTNRSPVLADPGPQATAEGRSVSLAVAGNDPDGNTLAWSATGLPAGLTIDPATGVIAGSVSYEASPLSPFWVTIRATDDGAPALGTETAFSWVVVDTNRIPLIVAPAERSDAEGATVSLAVVGSDPDEDGLIWSAAGLPPGLAIDPLTGAISGTIGFEAASASPYGVAVTAIDDGRPALSAGVSFLWAVEDTNRPPQLLHPGDLWAAEGDPISLAPVASDPDGDTLTWSAAGLPPGLVIDSASGAVSGNLSFEASVGSPHAVTLTVTDDRIPNLTGSVTFNVTVLNTNRAPLIDDPGAQAGAEGEAVLLALSGLDPDGDGLTWSAAGLPAGLIIDPVTGAISGTLAFEAAVGSPHTVAVTATDDGSPALSSGVAFLWTVADTNRPPQILDPGSPASLEGAPVSLPLTGWDPDGDSISWSAAGLPPGLAIDSATGDITGTTTFDSAGTHPVTVTATDDGTPSLSAQISFAWEVAGTNRAPEVVDPGAQSSAEGEAVTLLMDGFDPDGDHLAWSAAGLPPGLGIDPATGEISGTLGFSAAGSYAVVVTALDDGAPSLATPTSFAWMVADTNRAPVVVAPADRTDPEGAAVSLAVVGSDPDGDGLTWSAAGLPAGLAIDPSSGVISGTLDFGVAAGSPYRVTVAAADDGSPALVSGGTFIWSIGDVDRAPVLGSLPDRFGQVGGGVTATLTATDADGDPLTWSASGLPPGISLDGSGRLGGTLGGAGAFTVTVTVTAAGASDRGSFTWVVTAPGAPEIEPVGNQFGTVGVGASLAVSADDPGGGELVFAASGLPSGLAIDPATGVISGTPAAAGVFSVTVSVSDPAGGSASATFLWIVEAALDLPPEAQDDAVVVGRDELGEDGVVVVPVLGNDTDPEGETLTLAGVDAPAVGSADAVDGAVVFRPPAEWVGTVAFAYRVADPAGQEDEATVTITVERDLDGVPAASILQWRPPTGSGVAVPALGSSGTLLNTLVQSLHVLRVPLALLGGAVIWSLLLGGALNLGLALRRGLPAAFARRGRLMAIVMAAQGAKVPAFGSPGGGEVVHQYLATDSRIKSTGRRARAAGREWLEVLTDEGRAWVDALNLTEHLDRAFFAEDRAPWQLLERFVDALRRRAPLSGMVSGHGLWVAHHGIPLHYAPDRVARIWDDGEVRTWKGRNPAYPDLRGTFDTAVAAGVLDAHDHPRMELAPDQSAVPSTVIPVEFTNLHFISIGADLIGPERLDQTAWLVHFSYEEGKPRIIGLCREG